MQMLSLDDIRPTMRHLPTSGRRSFREWLDYAGIILRNERYSLRGHEYLGKIIDDEHPDQTFRKGAQVGISTTMALKGLFVAEHLGLKCVYYFQDDGQVSDFSNDRVAPIIEASSYLRERVRSTNNVGLKQIGPGSIYFRGLYTRGKAKSLDADYLILDELDEANEQHVAFAIDRLQHSKLQWVAALSQPSVPGFGIDERFSGTDQHHWHLKCPGCGHWNCLETTFPACFIPIAKSQAKGLTAPEGATHYRGCSKCHTRLDLSRGEWVPKYPGRYRRGYHISHLYAQNTAPGYPNLSTKLMAEYEDARRFQSRMARFVISILGFPYAGGNARVTDELLDALEGNYGMSFGEAGCVMGVDQGDVLTIAIAMLSGDILKCVYFEETSDWGRLDYLMQRFGVYRCLIDAQPNKHSAKAFAAKHHGRVWIQYFGSKDHYEDQELHEGRTVIKSFTVNRTESLDSLIDRMEAGYVQFPSRSLCSGTALATMEDVRRHCKQLISRTEQTANGVMKRVYLSGTIENHYGMALNSAALAAYVLGATRAPGPMILPVFGGGRAAGNA